jgi:hypothetical protein
VTKRLAGTLTNWGEVDGFGSLLAGPAWMRGKLEDEDVVGWARLTDRWWRRAALAATTVLKHPQSWRPGRLWANNPGSSELVDDRDDMVVKGGSPGRFAP